ARVRTVTEAEYEHAKAMLEQIEIFQTLSGMTDTQRTALENYIARVKELIGLVGVETPRSPIEDMELIPLQTIVEDANEFTTILDGLRSAGQHAAQQMRADWEAQFAAM